MGRTALVRIIADKIRSATNQAEKYEVLQQYSSESLFKRILSYANNPMINFNMDNWKPQHSGKQDGMGISKFMHVPEDIFQGKLDQEEAVFSANIALLHMNEQEVDLFIGMLKKDLDLGLDLETINDVWPGLIPQYPVQYPGKFTERKVESFEWPCVAQKLVGGYRVNIIVRGNSVEFRNQEGKVIHNFDHYVGEFGILAQSGSTVFDGVAVVVDEEMNVISTDDDIVLSARPENIRFILWDAIRYDGFVQGKDTRIGYNWRYNGLEHMMFLSIDKNPTPCYGLPENKVIDNISQALEFSKQLKNDIVIKNFSGTWTNGISNDELIINYMCADQNSSDQT